jgi:hypothetical protein
MPDGIALPASVAEAVEAAPTETDVTGHDGGMALDAGGASRREVLSRLFAGREVEIEWRNEAFANERVRDRLSGPPTELARLLLARVSYLMIYDTDGEEPRLARIVVFGSDPPSVTRGAGAPSTARKDVRTSEAVRRRAAIEAARRAITAAKRR